MEAKAFVFYRPDGKKSVPAMVVVFSEDGVTAVGDPKTSYGWMASSITESASRLEPTGIQKALEGYMDSNPPGPHSYGGRLEVLDYAGKNIATVDTIRDELLSQMPTKSKDRE